MVNIIEQALDKLSKFIRTLFPEEKTEKQRIGNKLDDEEFWPRDKYEKESYARLKKRESEL
jgi:hypothetical protein